MNTKPAAKRTSKPHFSRRLSALVLVLMGAGAGVFLWFQPVTPGVGKRILATPPEGAAAERLAEPAAAPASAVFASASPQAGVAAEVAAEGSASRPPSAEVAPPGERVHPHPIDEQRRRIYRENNLNASLAGAMNVGDYLGLRALIEEYRMDYPEDEHRLQEGYSLVADCLEQLTPERREAARVYWKEHRGSLVRRFIRRHCLDKDPPATAR